MTHARVDRAAPGKELRASEAGRSAIGPQSALQREADRASAKGPLSRLQRLADARKPMQRVLSHTTAIVTGEVDGCEQITAKVFKLTRNNGESVIIKFEVLGHQGVDEFEERADQTMHLANLVLQGVPGMTPITPADIVAINGIDATAAGKADAAILQNELANPAGIYVFKAETVNVGNNLREMVDNAQQEMATAKGRAGMAKAMNTAQALDATIMNANMMTSMGRMAAFDLLVNNYDRFRPDGTANLTNLDIGGGVALGIDNLNPNDRLLDPTQPGVDDWEARDIFRDEGSATVYARQVVDFLAEQTGHRQDNLVTFYNQFLQGFKAAAVQMRNQAVAMGARRNDPLLPGDKRNVAKFIYTRLNAVPF
jgi:hypothetical protein